jgi:hypothetical protein
MSTQKSQDSSKKKAQTTTTSKKSAPGAQAQGSEANKSDLGLTQSECKGCCTVSWKPVALGR